MSSRGGPAVKNPPAGEGDVSLIPGSGRSPGEGKGNPLQYSCLEHPMDRGAWRATVHGVTVGHDWAHSSIECEGESNLHISLRQKDPTVKMNDYLHHPKALPFSPLPAPTFQVDWRFCLLTWFTWNKPWLCAFREPGPSTRLYTEHRVVLCSWEFPTDNRSCPRKEAWSFLIFLASQVDKSTHILQPVDYLNKYWQTAMIFTRA